MVYREMNPVHGLQLLSTLLRIWSAIMIRIGVQKERGKVKGRQNDVVSSSGSVLVESRNDKTTSFFLLFTFS